jgi:hypothetical protein
MTTCLPASSPNHFFNRLPAPHPDPADGERESRAEKRAPCKMIPPVFASAVLSARVACRILPVMLVWPVESSSCGLQLVVATFLVRKWTG